MTYIEVLLFISNNNFKKKRLLTKLSSERKKYEVPFNWIQIIHIHMHMYMRMRMCMACTYIYIYITHTLVHTHMKACTHAHPPTPKYNLVSGVESDTYVHAHMHTCVCMCHACMYVCMPACVCVCAYVCKQTNFSVVFFCQKYDTMKQSNAFFLDLSIFASLPA